MLTCKYLCIYINRYNCMYTIVCTCSIRNQYLFVITHTSLYKLYKIIYLQACGAKSQHMHLNKLDCYKIIRFIYILCRGAGNFHLQFLLQRLSYSKSLEYPIFFLFKGEVVDFHILKIAYISSFFELCLSFPMIFLTYFCAFEGTKSLISF